MDSLNWLEEQKKAFYAKAAAAKGQGSPQANADEALTKKWREDAINSMFTGANQAQQTADLYQGQVGQQLGAFDQSTVEGQKQMRSDAGQSLAAGQSAIGGTMGGGGGYGALMQQGQQLGQDAAAFQSSQAKDRAGLELGLTDRASQAKADAISQLTGANQYAAEAGTETDNAQAKYADLQAAMDTIVGDHKGLVNDDEEAMAQEIYRQADQQPEPYRSWMIQYGDDIANGVIDV